MTMQADHVVCFVAQFMQDAQEVMDMLVKVQNDQGEMDPDDPQVRKRWSNRENILFFIMLLSRFRT